MANTSSAKKALRAQDKKHAKNLLHRKAYKASRKLIEKALAAGDAAAAQAELNNFYKQIDKAAKVGALNHANTAARYKSGLAAKVAAAQSGK